MGRTCWRGLNGFDPEAAIYDNYDNAHASERLDRMLYADSMVRLPDHSVMIVDRTTMAHGLEARAPFMDHKLAEFVARIPASLKVRGRHLRYIQTRLAERYLPPEIVHRKKQGFSSPLPYLLADEFKLLFETFLSVFAAGAAGLPAQGAAIQSMLADTPGPQSRSRQPPVAAVQRRDLVPHGDLRLHPAGDCRPDIRKRRTGESLCNREMYNRRPTRTQIGLPALDLER